MSFYLIDSSSLSAIKSSPSRMCYIEKNDFWNFARRRSLLGFFDQIYPVHCPECSLTILCPVLTTKRFLEKPSNKCLPGKRPQYQRGSWQTASQRASESCESCESSCEPCQTDSQSIFLSSAFGGFWQFGTSFRYSHSPFNIVLLSAFIFFIFFYGKLCYLLLFLTCRVLNR